MKTFSAEVVIQIPFHDVDVMEVAWHGHYAKYFELARGELLDVFDYNYAEMKASGYAWPVIDLQVKYVKSIAYQQMIKVVATLVEYEHRLKIRYVITDEKSGVRLTKGHTTQVAVDMSSGDMCFVSPPILLQKLGVDDA
ncbi:MAG: acyl-CoA thioesterase [Methylococcales bacterium]|jgi:acyl-CoA thioester hydrolase|nr:acyl-CoA thioesterase [Methylococcales bacterium]MBT7443213.1 acyl-CoA thioesterase [Methylococcales bacterium]